MSLYDDDDIDTSGANKPESNVAGWATGIKFLQSHMQLKKATVTQPKRDITRKHVPTSLTPVVNLAKGKLADSGSSVGVPEDDGNGGISTGLGFSLPYSLQQPKQPTSKRKTPKSFSNYLTTIDPEWQFEDEYDPLYPNDYERALRDLRERRDREAEQEEKESNSSSRRRGGPQDEEDEEAYGSSSSAYGRSSSSGGGAAIAPPPSLTTSNSDRDTHSGPSFLSKTGGGGGGTTAAARIMAKYGYKEGQGLGKKEQGMSTALRVEKTSFRTGKIIHEKDTPNPLGLVSSLAAYNDIDDDEEFEAPAPSESQPSPAPQSQIEEAPQIPGPPLAELLKNPSKVVLLKNMVGPGEVDDDLEPEVKEECQSKYGLVKNVTVFQMPDVDGEDAIRIFVEFTREESAVKALVDLNGRFFGGRQVRASFYDYDNYTNLELTL